MIYLLTVFLLFAAYWTGSLIREAVLGYGKQHDHSDLDSFGTGEMCLTGMFALFILWEADALTVSYTGISFSTGVRFYIMMVLTICAISAAIKIRNYKPKEWYSDFVIPKSFIPAVIIFIIQAVSYFLFYPDLSDDRTTESVLTILYSGRLHFIDPDTGMTNGYAVSFYGRLPELDSFYAMLAAVAGGSDLVYAILYRVAPILMLILEYMAYGRWIDIFCGKDNEGRKTAGILYSMLGILNICGSFSPDGIFYSMIHRGFRGENLVFSVLVPYIAYLCYLIFGNKRKNRIIYLLMAAAVTLFAADIQRSAVPVIAVMIISIAASLISRAESGTEKRRAG
ncbi:MAG: hypothetical protein K6C99_10100 [Lachnospiraceae bacterium]|nr:hypothetical protein [Lachnospiraceae bacterium]